MSLGEGDRMCMCVCACVTEREMLVSRERARACMPMSVIERTFWTPPPGTRTGIRGISERVHACQSDAGVPDSQGVSRAGDRADIGGGDGGGRGGRGGGAGSSGVSNRVARSVSRAVAVVRGLVVAGYHAKLVPFPGHAATQ